jgi:hypothetical protein
MKDSNAELSNEHEQREQGWKRMYEDSHFRNIFKIISSIKRPLKSQNK